MKLFYLLVPLLLLHHSVNAATSDITIKGQFTQTIPEKPLALNSYRAAAQSPLKTITLLKMELSPHAWDALIQRTENLVQPMTIQSPVDVLPQSKKTATQLGMGHVPVLEQGQHGTCATFAVTAALDAALDEGDYISQLCNLQLGQYLEQSGYTPSGWDGSLGALIFNQIRAFGVINTTTQHQMGCGGLTEYPTKTEQPPSDVMTLTDFHALSESIPEDDIAWSPVLDVYQVFLDKTDPNKTLESVKQALREKDRLTFGVLLFGLNEAPAGAAASYHKPNDTWALTPQIIEDILQQKNYGGHEMIITGFDDNAVAIDSDGHKHQGLLTIRNSWGETAGDRGNFYMSYGYFKLLTIEIQRIRSLASLKPAQ